MRLSKQERIAVLVIAVIIILGLGIFLFIVPQFQNIGTDTATLVNKQQELQTARDKAATKEDLKEQVIEAYKDGQDIADMFFEEMKPYEADNEIRNFIQYCKDNGVKVSVDSMTISSPVVSELGVTFTDEEQITYDLKTAARGESADQEASEEEQRMNILREALANTQSVASIDVTLTVSALDPDTLISFADLVNDYKKADDGNVRKAIRLSSGLAIQYPDVETKYNKVINDMTLDLNYDALKELADKHDIKIPSKADLKKALGLDEGTTAAAADGDGENAVAANNNKDDEITEFPEEYIYSAEVTVTLYSLERMQDPTDKLIAQDQQ